MIDLSATVAVIAMRSGDIASRLLAIRSDVLQFPQRISQRDCSLFGIPGAVGALGGSDVLGHLAAISRTTRWRLRLVVSFV